MSEREIYNAQVREIISALVTSGGFQLGETLGTGTSSMVFSVTKRNDPPPGELVAKVLSPLLESQRQQDWLKLRYEAEVATYTANGNFSDKLPKMFHYFSANHSVQIQNETRLITSYFIMLERINGKTLESHVESGGPFAKSAFDPLADKLILAINYLHGLGFYHRDIKPGNILLYTSADNETCLKLIDFGFCTQNDKTNGFYGSLPTMCPEFFRNRYVRLELKKSEWSAECSNKLADYYSIGATIYYALHGRYPIWNVDENATNHPEYCKEFFLTNNELENNPEVYWARVEKYYKKPSSQISKQSFAFLNDLLAVDPTKRPKHVHSWVS